MRRVFRSRSRAYSAHIRFPHSTLYRALRGCRSAPYLFLWFPRSERVSLSSVAVLGSRPSLAFRTYCSIIPLCFPHGSDSSSSADDDDNDEDELNAQDRVFLRLSQAINNLARNSRRAKA
ncbi:hypothetical protein P692DRAFT_201870056 [Suillus brevipes Sb2]|nr:hypothetical protein P692DRAFT_201870056 [Suillus brevipes Sb2]